MKVIIQTQTYENYGAHDWDGKGACPQHWKPKGGDTFIITCKAHQKESLLDLVKVNNAMFIEEVIDIIECEEAFFNVRDYCADYARPIFIEMGHSCWVAHRVSRCEFDEFDWTKESWIAGKAQSREAVKRQVSIDGRVMDWADYAKEKAA
jgi:hypothetical protein